MFNRRALQIAVAGALATGTLLTGSAGSAFAAPPPPQSANVRVQGVIRTIDDDGSSRPSATKSFGFTTTLRSGDPVKVVTIPSACAGGEVRAELDIAMNYFQGTNTVTVGSGTNTRDAVRLFEGASSSTTDLDGVGPVPRTDISLLNSSFTRKISVGNLEEGGADGVSVEMTISRVP